MAFLENSGTLSSVPGDIVHVNGTVVGRHLGTHRYTIGQRKGLGIPSALPLYVLRKEGAANRLVVGREDELGRGEMRVEGINWLVDAPTAPLHVEIKNHLSLVTRNGGEETVKKSLAEIEREVLREFIGAKSEYKGKEDELVRLSFAIRDAVLKGDVEGEELLCLLREL